MSNETLFVKISINYMLVVFLLSFDKGVTKNFNVEIFEITGMYGKYNNILLFQGFFFLLHFCILLIFSEKYRNDTPIYCCNI